MMEVFKTGELVRITYENQTVDGEVKLASSNGVSLMLEFDAMLGGYVRLLPCLWAENRNAFLDLIENKPVKIERVKASAP
jgi:hypothetical protein